MTRWGRRQAAEIAKLCNISLHGVGWRRPGPEISETCNISLHTVAPDALVRHSGGYDAARALPIFGDAQRVAAQLSFLRFREVPALYAEPRTLHDERGEMGAADGRGGAGDAGSVSQKMRIHVLPTGYNLCCMAKAQLVAAVIAAVALVPDAAGQRPVIQTGGIQNAGSFVASNPPSVSPQMLVTIRGENLAVSTEIANVIPLPTSLAGTSVTFNGTLAPLLYVSPVQINAQVPSALRSLVDLNGNVATVVTTPSGSSDPVTAYVDSQQFGIFTQGATGCGQAVAFNIHSDGRDITMNTPQNSFDPESDLGLAIFLTGDGFSPDRVDGVPWIFNPADNKISPSFYTLGILFGVPGMTGGWAPFTAQYEGPAPGMIGVDQVNGLGQWKGSPQGCRVPMYLVYFGYDASQVVNISIHPGGGKCVDPPESTLGMIAWQRTSISDVGGSNTQDAIMAQFIQTDGLGFPDSGTLTSAGSTTCCAPDAQPAYCDGSLPSTLDAGMLTFTGPGIDSLTVPGSTRNGRITYEAILPAVTLRGGDYQVIGSGGSQVGAFD